MNDESRVFFYVDGIPTKGRWVDLDKHSDWDTVRDALNIAPEYGGDILAADAEGLAKCFLGDHGSFSWESFTAFADELHDSEHEAAAAYIDHVGSHYATPDGFRDAYAGEYPSMADYAEELTRECGDPIPEHLDRFIDWERMGEEMEMDGYYTSAAPDGGVFVFRSC